MGRGVLALGAAIAIAVACTRGSSGRGSPPSPTDVDPIAHLRAFESARRAQARFVETPLQDRAFGPDPYDIATLADGRLVGILRGRDALVVLDSELHELGRMDTPRLPSALAVYEGLPAGELHSGDALVTSEVEPVLAHYRVPRGAPIQRLADVSLGDAYGARDIATGPEGVVYVIEEHDDRLLTLSFSGARVERHERRVPRGPLRLSRTRGALFVASLLEHAISVFPVDRGGLVDRSAATATIDGPYWGLDAIDAGDDTLVIAGGAEDHPLDRRGGFFGYVDSFAYVYRWVARTRALERIAAINVSELGLIVPKAIAFERSSRKSKGLAALVTSYGGANAVRLVWTDGLNAPPTTTTMTAPPGTSAIVSAIDAGGLPRFVAANPLLDAWVALDASGARVVRAEAGSAAEADTRGERERIGEALFFTGLMAKAGSAEGPKSRFSCETCHFEGYVDGRVHHTGRGDVHATTKPLVGLFNNRPHFSRALDPDFSSVAENEFRVAGAPSPVDPHFDIDVRAVPWLADSLGSLPSATMPPSFASP